MTTFADLAKIVVVRPIDVWPGQRTPDGQRRPSPFEASWRSTVELLTREVDHLRTGNEKAVLALGVTEAQLRRDGLPRSDARIDDPGVVLTVPSEHGQLTYPCDTFTGRSYRHSGATWQHNLRAVALALEALRKVDRYGVTPSGQQYAGWKQLPAGGDSTAVDPVELLVRAAHGDGPRPTYWHGTPPSRDGLRRLVRAARNATHPDRPGGSHDTFLAVQRAAEQLGVA